MEILKSLRAQNNLTQTQVAKQLGITQQAYANYESGKREPDNKMLISLSKIFNVSIDYILGQDEKETAPTEQPLPEDVRRLFSLSENLTDDERQKVIDYALLIIKARNQ